MFSFVKSIVDHHISDAPLFSLRHGSASPTLPKLYLQEQHSTHLTDGISGAGIIHSHHSLSLFFTSRKNVNYTLTPKMCFSFLIVAKAVLIAS